MRIVSTLILILLTTLAFAHDHDRPENNDWLKGLHSQNKTWCCKGDDTDAIDEWDTKGDRYRVKFRGEWFDVPESALVDGSNKGGDALALDEQGLERNVGSMLFTGITDLMLGQQWVTAALWP